MQKGLIGVQMMMLKDKVEQDGIYEVLRRLSELGYHAVEVSQIDMTREVIEGLKQGCKDFEFTIAALSCGVEDLAEGYKYPGDTLQNDFDKIVADCHELGCSILRIGMLPMNYMGSLELVMDFTRKCEEYATRLKAKGIDLYYHAHHMEFHKYDGKFLLEIMRENTVNLGFELDSHWMWRGGVDPIRYIPTFAGRIRAIHLKDYRIAQVDMAQYPGNGREKVFYMFNHIVQYAEVGEGTLPMPEIIAAGLESGSEFFLIEQDEQYGRDPYDCLVTSRDNLIRMGFAEWFRA